MLMLHKDDFQISQLNKKKGKEPIARAKHLYEIFRQFISKLSEN